jgi:hypothetical protein
MKLWTYDAERLTEELNRGKEIFVKAMFAEGAITAQQYEVMQEHSIILANKGFFGSLWDKIFKKKDAAYYFVVKIVRPKNPSIARDAAGVDEEE